MRRSPIGLVCLDVGAPSTHLHPGALLTLPYSSVCANHLHDFQTGAMAGDDCDIRLLDDADREVMPDGTDSDNGSRVAALEVFNACSGDVRCGLFVRVKVGKVQLQCSEVSLALP